MWSLKISILEILCIFLFIPKTQLSAYKNEKAYLLPAEFKIYEYKVIQHSGIFDSISMMSWDIIVMLKTFFWIQPSFTNNPNLKMQTWMRKHLIIESNCSMRIYHKIIHLIIIDTVWV